MIIIAESHPSAFFIESFLTTSFPFPECSKNQCTVDLIAKELYGSGKLRLGAAPSLESQSELKRIVSFWVERGEPIPLLSPWGSEKPDGSGLDIAEVCAIKTLSCLNQRIQRVYNPGIKISIRLEDVSAPHLLYERMEEARRDAAAYTNDFVKLIRVMGANFIKPVPESSLISETDFNAKADQILSPMRDYLAGDNHKLNDLRDLGMSGEIDDATRSFYYNRYEKLYPEKEHDERIHVMARYFAGAIARRLLGILGNDSSWKENFLELSFAGVVPGLNVKRQSRRLYYRTIPENLTKCHMAPWRAKGYFAIDGCAIPKLMSFRDVNPALNTFAVLLDGNGERVKVNADYILAT